jgi:hypothetical protein
MIVIAELSFSARGGRTHLKLVWEPNHKRYLLYTQLDGDTQWKSTLLPWPEAMLVYALLGLDLDSPPDPNWVTIKEPLR